MTSGLEWNLKISQFESPYLWEKVCATFETYQNTAEFTRYDETSRERLTQALRHESGKDNDKEDYMAFMDVTPYPYQEEILDKIRAEREIHERNKNLVVAATGTGKTVIAAFDFKRVRKEQPNAKFLFVVHREEILKQSRFTFRNILRDQNFGELLTGHEKPESFDHLFCSIQSLNSQDLCYKLPEDYYDYIVIDEFHHAAANGYQELLEHFKPKYLLALTATPERHDGLDVLKYFDYHIAAEIRLPDAINRKLLSPFQYFGISDSVDLSTLKWSNGGYDKTQLNNIFTGNHVRANLVLQKMHEILLDINDCRALCFCVSQNHAEFMNDFFNAHGVNSAVLTAQSSVQERNSVQGRLIAKEINVICAVDLYNEGVDIPEVNTVLFLRPTESLTIFLQQLGRGLRLSEGKDCLTVLDFIGQANRKYNFEDKFAALLANTNHSVQYELKNGFVSAPKGCYIQLEKKAAKAILDNIKSSFGIKSGLVSRIATFEEDSGLPLSLTNFVTYYRLDVRAIYSKFSFSRLCVIAGIRENFEEPVETVLTKAFGRLSAIDSRRWIQFLLKLLPHLDDTDFGKLSPIEKRMLQMFYITVWGKSVADWNSDEVLDNLYTLADSPVMLMELMELLQYKYDHIDFIDAPVDLGFDSPLDLLCPYTRDQLLVALDFLKPKTLREGVKYFKDKKTDVLLITLNKSDKDYSPTTMYNDYSINESLFHWQSQSTTSENSPTGKRYRSRNGKNGYALLFVRDRKSDEFGPQPFVFLGTVTYMKHEGSRPMNIVWYMDMPIPAKFIKKTNKLTVG